MNKLICMIIGHDEETHLDYIYGSLPREHVTCRRCETTLKFERPSREREEELYCCGAGDIRDGDVRGCQPL